MANTKSKKSPKLNIKKGDRVLVIAGADKGVEGEVLEIFPNKQRAIVDQVNIVSSELDLFDPAQFQFVRGLDLRCFSVDCQSGFWRDQP